MKFVPENSLLNELATPIVITTTDGIVLFKNKLAHKHIKLARTKFNILKHLMPCEREKFKLLGHAAATNGLIIRLGLQNELHALICEHKYGQEVSYAWIFADCFQLEAILTESQTESSVRFSQLLKNSLSNITSENLKSTSTQLRRYDALTSLSKTVYSAYFGNIVLNQSRKSLHRIVDLIDYFSEKVFLNLGYIFKIESGINQDNSIFIDQANICATAILKLSSLFLDSILGNKARIDIRMDIAGIAFELSGTFDNQGLCHANEKPKLSQVFPKRHLMNLQILEGLAKTYDWKFDTELTTKSGETLMTVRMLVKKFEDRRGRIFWQKDGDGQPPLGEDIRNFFDFLGIE